MTWEQTVADHPVWARLQALEDTCRAEGWPEDVELRDLRRRARWVVEHVRARYEVSEAYAITAPSLAALQQGLDQLVNVLAQARANPAGPHVAQGHPHCDALVQAVAPWSPAKQRRAVAGVVRAGRDYQDEVERRLTDLRAEVQSLGEEAAAQADAAKATQSSFQVRATEITRALSEQSARVDSQLNSLSATFQSAEAERATTASKAAEKARAEVEELLSDLRRDGAEAQEQEREEAAGVQAELGRMQTEARKTLGAIGVEATASHYSTYAKQERRAGHFWNALAVLIGLAGAGTLVWALRSVSEEARPSWQLLTLKAAAGLVLLTVAGYAGREAKGHRDQERDAKRVALGLAAIDPFLANVGDEATKALRLKLAATLFVRPDENGAAPGPARGPAGLPVRQNGDPAGD